MAKCEVCGNDYDKSFELIAAGARHTFDSFECATLAFSRKLENLKAAVTLYFAHYNFCRIHSTLRVPPAMQAEITDHVWTIAELLSLS